MSWSETSCRTYLDMSGVRSDRPVNSNVATGSGHIHSDCQSRDLR